MDANIDREWTRMDANKKPSRTADGRRFTQIISASIEFMQKLPIADFWAGSFLGKSRERTQNPKPDIGQIFLT
jgi:hypothetical protein